MKNVALLLILLIGSQLSYSQVFQKTKKYSVKTEKLKGGQTNQPYTVDLYKSGDFSKKLSSLTIEDTELFEDIFITSLKNPGLEGINEVIKVEIEYLACCAHVEAYYYMVTKNEEIIPLPKLNNLYCENSDTDFQYTFPNQKHGVKNNILETETFYTKSYAVKKVDLKQSTVWSDNPNFKFSEETAITAN